MLQQGFPRLEILFFLVLFSRTSKSLLCPVPLQLLHSSRLAVLRLPSLCTVSRNCCSSFPSPTPSTPSRLRKQVSPFLLSTPRGPRQCVARRGIVFFGPLPFLAYSTLNVCSNANWRFLHASLISSSSSAVRCSFTFLSGFFPQRAHLPANVFSTLWPPSSTLATSFSLPGKLFAEFV